MIVLLYSLFIILVMSLALMMSYELRLKAKTLVTMLWPMSKTKLVQFNKYIQHMNIDAASRQTTQQYWYIQQWWVIISGLSLLFMLVIVASTGKVDPTWTEADYLKKVDPQIYNLLHGEVLVPPPVVDDQLINAAIIDAKQLDQNEQAQPLEAHNTVQSSDESDRHTTYLNTQFVDRKWDRMNPRYKQRLLIVFKIMKERYQYDMVLIEGYRSPARQSLLYKQTISTKARAYQSYHQFGLAADIAFIRDRKVVINERDPWVMQAYQRYGAIAESVGLTWGGRWKSIQDYGHTELRLPGLEKTQEMAERLSTEGQFLAAQPE